MAQTNIQILSILSILSEICRRDRAHLAHSTLGVRISKHSSNPLNTNSTHEIKPSEA
jgi:hypothetical protein